MRRLGSAEEGKYLGKCPLAGNAGQLKTVSKIESFMKRLSRGKTGSNQVRAGDGRPVHDGPEIG